MLFSLGIGVNNVDNYLKKDQPLKKCNVDNLLFIYGLSGVVNMEKPVHLFREYEGFKCFPLFNTY